MMNTNELAKDLEAGWRRFRDLLDRLDPAALEQTTPAGWTIKEMTGHVAFWEEATEAVIVTMLRDDRLPDGWSFGSGYDPESDGEWPRADVHNAREAEWARTRPAAEVIARLDRAHDRAMAVARTFTDAEVSDPRFRSYIAEKIGHYDEHRPELETLVQSGSSAG